MYDKSQKTPVAHQLNYKEYIGFFQVGYPNQLQDMQDIINAIEKLEQNKEELQKSRDSIGDPREYDSGRGI